MLSIAEMRHDDVEQPFAAGEVIGAEYRIACRARQAESLLGRFRSQAFSGNRFADWSRAAPQRGPTFVENKYLGETGIVEKQALDAGLETSVRDVSTEIILTELL